MMRYYDQFQLLEFLFRRLFYTARYRYCRIKKEAVGPFPFVGFRRFRRVYSPFLFRTSSLKQWRQIAS